MMESDRHDTDMQTDANKPEIAAQAVLVKSEELPSGSVQIRGHDFNHGSSIDDVMESFSRTGLQATSLGRAVDVVNSMLSWRVPIEQQAVGEQNDELSVSGRGDRCKIFLGYTSNLVSAGVREQIRYLVEHKMVDVLVTTAGGVEEDVIKCLAPTYVGDFQLKGSELRMKGINRAGNMLIPNSNYCKFEDWVMPILDKMLQEQEQQGVLWTPSRVIERLGKEIGKEEKFEESICYWAAKNGIPIFCPALTDGSLGDMLYFHTYKATGLVIDIVHDIRLMNDQAMKAAPRKTGVIILGGGVPKHHICNANLMRNGADYAVYLNTAQEFDGSDSGARPDEAVSWGKIRADATAVKVHGDASILFPLLVSQTFAKQNLS
eukprot:jgi/Picsp_1/91/NSC_00091-R1_deoxyhypusine synthase